MDSQKQDGIQKLLQAEQEANAIVTAERQGGFSFSNYCIYSSHCRSRFSFLVFSLDCWMFAKRIKTPLTSLSLLPFEHTNKQKKRRELNKPKTKRKRKFNRTETSESNSTNTCWRKPREGLTSWRKSWKRKRNEPRRICARR